MRTPTTVPLPGLGLKSNACLLEDVFPDLGVVREGLDDLVAHVDSVNIAGGGAWCGVRCEEMRRVQCRTGPPVLHTFRYSIGFITNELQLLAIYI